MEKVYQKSLTAVKNLILSILSVIKAFYLTKFKPVTFDQATKDEVLIVIANGPSLKQNLEDDIGFFQQNVCIVSNKFALSEHFQTIKPAFYVWLDSYMWTSQHDEIQKTIQILVENVLWPMVLFVPGYAMEATKKKLIGKSDLLVIKSYNYVFYQGFRNFGHWLYKYNFCSPRAASVTVISLFLGINLGFKRILLAGADQNWHENIMVDEKNILLSRLQYFYKEKLETKYIPYYKDQNTDTSTYSITEFFEMLSKTFRGFSDIAAYARYRKVEVFNLSLSSYIDVFQKRTIAELNNKKNI